ncbi:MAG: UDP-N-acetylmuramate--L-alanine ligase [Alphaproteobacteria bacterium]|nr:UDP-N-acetylmuramate--L-alanine ligase [Alphaproteobacteria bacterium]MCB9974285.1 UDP-N-acetylmuramate--L-alanine ligase [Rhodospirillales bacterium]
MRIMSPDIGTLHFIGIGGIGMSGIAILLNALGYRVQGSDQAEGANVARLREMGIKVTIGHVAANIFLDEKGELPAAVVISSAVKTDNPEVAAAREARVPVVRRAEMLAELMRLKSAVAVAGTHGKTTTTSMVGQMLDTAGFDPTVVNGGIVNAYGTNMRFGQSDAMVVEADESDGSFTRLPATVAVITNIDPEHMDHYGSFDEVREAYRRFVLNLPFYGYALLCLDHPEVQALVPQVSQRRVITYGFNPQADIRATNIRHDAKGSTFDLTFSAWLSADDREQTIKDLVLPMPGRHNVQNCLVALGVANEMSVPPETMRKALSGFTGVKRRFTEIGKGADITVIDDYAHHPVEIEVVLKTARTVLEKKGAKVIAVFQPHRYSRLKDLFEEFCRCFNEADSVIIADIYAAGETPIEGLDKHKLAAGIHEHGHRDSRVLESRDKLASQLAEIASPGDYVICMGAGDITAWAQALPAQIEEEARKRKGRAA